MRVPPAAWRSTCTMPARGGEAARRSSAPMPELAGAAPGGRWRELRDPGRRRRDVRAGHQLRPGRHHGRYRPRHRGRPAAAEPGAGAGADPPDARRAAARPAARDHPPANGRRSPRRWCASASWSSIFRKSPNLDVNPLFVDRGRAGGAMPGCGCATLASGALAGDPALSGGTVRATGPADGERLIVRPIRPEDAERMARSSAACRRRTSATASSPPCASCRPSRWPG